MNVITLHSRSLTCSILFLAFLNAGQSERNFVGFGLESQKVVRTLTAAIFEMLQTSVIVERQEQTFNLYTRALGKEGLAFFGDIVDGLMSSVGQEIAVQVGVQRPIGGNRERHYGVLLVDSTISLRFLYKELLKYHFNVLGYYIILLYNPYVHYSADLYSAIQLNWQLGNVDANVLIHALPDLVLLFTSFPYTRFHCAGVTPVITNRFSQGRWQHAEFFPEKLANIYGCTLVCATWEDLPYFQTERNNKTGRLGYVGIEGKLLENLRTSLNFTVEFYWMNDTEIDQTMEKEGTVFDKFFKSGVEFSMGAYLYKPTSTKDPYAPSTGYYASSFDIVLNSKARPYSSYAKLLFPFVKELWILLVIIFVVGITTTVVAGYLNSSYRNFILGHNNQTPIYNMFVVTLGGGLSLLPQRNFARFLLFLWILGSLVLRSAYQAFLYHFIRADINMPPPRSIDDIHAQDYTLLMTDLTWNAVKNLSRIRARSEVINGREHETFDMLRYEDPEATSQLAVLTPFEYFGYFRRTHDHSEDFYVVPEHVFTQQLSIYMRKNSIFLPHFNRRILYSDSSGLLKKAAADFVDTGVKRRRHGGQGRPKSIELSQLYGPNVILMTGCCVAAIAFVFELVMFSVGRWFRRGSDPTRGGSDQFYTE